MKNKLIKLIATKRYEIELFEGTDHLYYIRYDNKTTEPQDSEGFMDFKMALYMFDLKVNELEGN